MSWSELLEQSPLFDTTVFYKTALDVLDEAENGVIVKACLAMNIDPEIVKKQTTLILKLQRALDIKLNNELGLNAPSYKKYVELEKENLELKSRLEQIADICN